MTNQIETIYFLIFLCLSAVVPFVLVFISKIFAVENVDNEKLSAYECGFEPFQDARLKFEIHFYLIAILFLIFDIEIIYLFLWALVSDRLDFIAYFSMFFFLFFLTGGFFYEWKKGALNWGV